MAKNPYNGFPPDVRSAGGRWYRSMREANRLLVRHRCVCCWSADRVNGHSEDYSTPHGPHIGAFDLCWLCHMMIHCRFRNPKRFDEYVDTVELNRLRWRCNGMVFEDFVRDFLATALPVRRSEPFRETPLVLLSDIRAGKYNPNVGGLVKWAPDDKLAFYNRLQTRDMF
jgi:hypothetical protein